jgi:hypothetical protein
MAFNLGKTIACAASAGLLLGALACDTQKGADSPASGGGKPVGAAAEGKACCKAQNECKGKGSCAVEGKWSCAGNNECKGQGGCNGHCPK